MRYLSLEWMETMQAHVAVSESLTQLASTNSIGVTQVVTDGPEGNVVYHLQVGDGVAEFGPGPAAKENVRMEQSWQSSVDVATGVIPAQEVFMKGLVKISGDPQSIIDNVAVLAALSAVFGTVGSSTEYH